MTQTDAPLRAPAARGRADAYALVRVGGRTIAIASRFVTRAIESPGELTPLPRRRGAIEGVMTLGSRVLPVVSLARWLDAEAAASTDTDADAIARAQGLVLLLKDGDDAIGLAVEAVVGVRRARADQVRRLFHDDDPEELFQSAALFERDDAATSILEPRRLMALAGVWAADAGADPAADGQGASESETTASTPMRATQTVAHATFRIADAHVALPAANVGELLRRPSLRRELPPNDGVLGLCEWRDRLVPVVDLAGVLHAMPTGDAAAWVCIVSEGDLAIGIVVHEVLDIARLVCDAGTSEHGPDTAAAVIGRRLVIGERTLQVIDVAALLRRYPETAISRKGARAAQLRTNGDPAAPAYMVFDAGSLFAARIDGVQEVVALPDDLRPRLDAGLSATLQWRQQAVPVTAIADGLVALPAQAARQLVIVRQDERLAALPIAGVKALVPRGIALRNRMRMQGRPVEVISVETDEQSATYPVIDLVGALRPAA